MTPRKPGRRFWACVHLADLFSPGSGAHRVNARLQELYEDGRSAHLRNSELQQENRALRLKLFEAQGERNMFLVQDVMNGARTPETQFVN